MNTDYEAAIKAVENAERSVATATAKLAKARKALEHSSRKNIPEPSSEVIMFSARYNGSTRVYSYAARKVVGRWYTTGSTCPPSGFSWTGLMDHIWHDGEIVGGVVEMRDANEW